MKEFGFMMIKPHAVKEHLDEVIEGMIEEAGLIVCDDIAMRMSREEAEELYEKHRGRDYFDWLVNQVTDGRVIAFLVESENTCERLRRLAGPTKPEDARINAPRSIRALLTRPAESFLLSREEHRAVDNVVHTPDPNEEGAVAREGKLFFFPDYF